MNAINCYIILKGIVLLNTWASQQHKYLKHGGREPVASKKMTLGQVVSNFTGQVVSSKILRIFRWKLWVTLCSVPLSKWHKKHKKHKKHVEISWRFQAAKNTKILKQNVWQPAPVYPINMEHSMRTWQEFKPNPLRYDPRFFMWKHL